MTKRTRLLLVGCGSMARYHVENILKQQDTTEIAGIVEPAAEMLEAAEPLFRAAHLPLPPRWPDLGDALARDSGEFDSAFIVTPHALHREQAIACMEAGLDVLLEKPMVVSAAEAQDLMAARDRTGRELVVAFTGSLSTHVRTAARLVHSGELGTLLNIHGVVWQNWCERTLGTWRQQPDISGGGFLFDTGAHLLNTVADIAGEEFVEVAAWLDNRGAPVDINGTVMARLASGAFVTLSACGDALPSCNSDVRIICHEGMLRVGVWGEFLEIQRAGEKKLVPVPLVPSLGVWEQFLAVRAGRLKNPCPPEVGLRMALLWDAIQESARRGGRPVSVVPGAA